MTLENVCGLTDAELLSGLERLVRADRRLGVKLLLHVGELDGRGAYRELAYGSTHEYLVKALHMSDAEAYLRIYAARLGRRFPRVLELFGQGELHLSAIKLVGPILTAENCSQVLERARGRSKREVELLVAELAPKPDVPARVRKLPAPRVRTAPALAPPVSGRADTASAAAGPEGATFVLQSPQPRASLEPLSPGRFTLELTLNQDGYDKLQQLRELLRHQVPSGDLACLVQRALDLLHEQTLKQRFAQTKPKTPKASAASKELGASENVRSRYVPRAVVREVYARDGGQCSFVSADGRRCEACGFLELHHGTPFARGGASSSENLRLMCRAHNALLAELDYGRDWMRARKPRTAESALPLRAAGIFQFWNELC